MHTPHEAEERMAARSRPAGNLRSESPSSGTKKIEQRRSGSGSGSRQLINSEFIRKVDDIPIVHNTLEYLLSAYGVIKDANPVVRSGLERSEDIANWVKQKAEGAVSAVKLDAPIKRLDTVAASGIVRIEQGRENLLRKVTEANQRVQGIARDGSNQLRRRADDLQYVFFETIQTFLDLVEDRFEPVMLEPSPEAVKFSTEPGFYMTMGRMLDLTYRLNLGILHYSARRAREISSPEAWTAFLKKNFSPEKIRLRAGIIRQESLAPAGSELRYVHDQELTELDRRLITLSRFILATAKTLGDGVREAPSKASLMVWGTVQYAGGVLSHLGEAKTMNDLLGIGLGETRLVAEGARDWLPLVNRFGVLDSTIQWMMAQEKAFKLN